MSWLGFKKEKVAFDFKMQGRGPLSINSTFFAGASRLFKLWKFNIASAEASMFLPNSISVLHIVDLRSLSKNTLRYDLLCFLSQEIGTRGEKWTLWEKLLERNGVIISFSTTDKLLVAPWASLPPSALVTEMGYDDCASLPARLWTLSFHAELQQSLYQPSPDCRIRRRHCRTPRFASSRRVNAWGASEDENSIKSLAGEMQTSGQMLSGWSQKGRLSPNVKVIIKDLKKWQKALLCSY